MYKDGDNFISKLYRGNRPAIFALFLFALILRWLYTFLASDPSMWGDVQFYDLLAVDFSNFVFGTEFAPVVPDPTFGPFQQFDLIRPPLYSVILGCCYAVFGHSLLVGQLINGVFGSFVVILVFYTARALFDSRIGWIASLYTAIYPPFIYLCGVVYPETVYSLLLVACAGFIVHFFKRDKFLYVALSAAGGGLAVMARPNFIATLPFLAIVFLFANVRPRRRWLAVGLFILVSAIALIPRPLYNYLRYDLIALTGVDGGYALFLGNNPTSSATDFDRTELTEYSEEALTLESDAIRDVYYRKLAFAYIEKHPIETAKRWLIRPFHFFHFAPEVRQADFTVMNTLFKWLNLSVYGPVLLLWIVGFFVLKERRVLLPLNVTIISMAIALMPVTMRVRYRIPVEPLMIIIATGTLIYILKKGIERIKNKGKNTALQNREL